jgi:hypothetical protein
VLTRFNPFIDVIDNEGDFGDNCKVVVWRIPIRRTVHARADLMAGDKYGEAPGTQRRDSWALTPGQKPEEDFS